MGFLKKVAPPPQKVAKGGIASRVKKDRFRGEKLFHFQLLETSSAYWLFNANRQLIQKFPKSNNVSVLRQKREIRSYALELFLRYEGSQEGVGGYTYD